MTLGGLISALEARLYRRVESRSPAKGDAAEARA
jgi:hypothetical protein